MNLRIPEVHQAHRVQTLVAAKAAVLFGLALYFALTIASGNLTNYINTRFAWLSYVAVVLFAALGAAALLEMRGTVRRSHTIVRLPSLLLMAVPLVLGTLIPSRPLGVESIERGSLQVGAASFGGANIALVTKDPLDRDVLDWARVFAGEESPTVFNDQPAKVLGFVYTEPNFPPGMFMVARFTLSCCTADALPLGLPVSLGEAATAPEDGAWVEVEGTFRAQEFLGAQMPVLQVARLTPTTEPDEPYLYP